MNQSSITSSTASDARHTSVTQAEPRATSGKPTKESRNDDGRHVGVPPSESTKGQPLSEEIFRDRLEECRRVAKALYEQSPNWLIFFREILGVDGVVARLFPDSTARRQFEQSPHAVEIMAMLQALRQQAGSEAHPSEPLRMITVRLPASVHEFIRAQAAAHGMSMNQYCISRLVQWDQSSERVSTTRELTSRLRRKPRPK